MRRLHQRRLCLCRRLLSTSQFLIAARTISRYFLILLIMPAHPIRLTTTSAPSFQMGVTHLQIDFTGIQPDLPKACIIAKVNNAARAVAAYYGRFPVSSARIVIVVAAGEHGFCEELLGKERRLSAVTRLVMAGTPQQNRYRRIVTHELVHMALASLPDSQHWLEEGIATYVEPIARSQAGRLGTERVWADMWAACGTANRRHLTVAWITRIPGAARIGAEPCSAWLRMLRYAGRRTTLMGCKMRSARLSQRAGPSTKIGRSFAS